MPCRRALFDALLVVVPRLVLQFETRVADVAETPAWIFFQASPQQRPHVCGSCRGESRPRWLTLEDGGDRVGHRRPGERCAAGEHLIQDTTERPDICPLVERPATRLLGAHIGRSTENHTVRMSHLDRHGRHMRSDVRRRVSDRLRQSEVEHFHGAVLAHLDVGRLEIAMDDALLVGGFEGLGDLSCDGQGIVDGDRPVHHAIGERRPLDQLHDERQHAASLLEPVKAGDILMIQGREDLCLSTKASEPIRIRRKGIGQHLEGIVSIERDVVCAPDPAHPAFTNQGGESVLTEESPGCQRHSPTILRRCHHPGVASRGKPPAITASMRRIRPSSILKSSEITTACFRSIAPRA